VFFEENSGTGGGLVVVDASGGVAVKAQFIDSTHDDDDDEDGSKADQGWEDVGVTTGHLVKTFFTLPDTITQVALRQTYLISVRVQTGAPSGASCWTAR